MNFKGKSELKLGGGGELQKILALFKQFYRFTFQGSDHNNNNNNNNKTKVSTNLT